MELSEIYLGGTDAESDEKLEAGFFETNDVKEILVGRRFIILGRKGAGKSSLYDQLPRLAKEKRWGEPPIEVLNLSSGDFEWDRIVGLDGPSMPGEAFASLSWELSVHIRLAETLLRAKPWWRRSAAEWKLARTIWRAFGGRKVGESVFEWVSRQLKSIEEADVPIWLGGGGIKKKDAPAKRARLLDVSKAVRDAVGAALPADRRFIVQLDKLDERWDGSGEVKIWLVGLLKAAKKLNDDYREPVESARRQIVKIVVYLRTDIYETLRFDELDKLRSFENQISWNEASLTAMLEKRLPDGLGLAGVLDANPISRAQRAPQYFFDRTFLRPREVIQFLQSALEAAPQGSKFVSNDLLKEVVKTFSTWKVDDLKLEYAKANPHLSDLIEAFRQGPHRYDSLAEIEERLTERAPSATTALGPRGALDLLFNASVVGVRISTSGRILFRVNDPTLKLPNEASVYVHPGLHSALNITEKRNRA